MPDLRRPGIAAGAVLLTLAVAGCSGLGRTAVGSVIYETEGERVINVVNPGVNGCHRLAPTGAHRVENRGATACELPAGPAVAILDASGRQLLESAPTDAPGPSLDPGAVATFTVLFSNWCEEAAALPLHVALRAGDAAIPVPDLDLTADDLPPCNGPCQPPTISANPWESVSG